MADAVMPISAATSSSERKRAHDRFNATLAVHGAAMNIFEVLPSLPNGRAAMAAGLRVNRGMSPAYTLAQFDSYVEKGSMMWKEKKALATQPYSVLH